MATTKQLVQVAKDLFIDTSKAILKSYLSSIIAIPIVGTIVNSLIDFFVGKIADGLEVASFFVYTDVRVTAEGRAYFDAKIKGYEVELNGTPEQKKAAEDAIKTAFYNLAHFNS